MRLFLLDTNMVSYILKGQSPAARARLIALSPNESAGISTITEAELLYGLAKAGSSSSSSNHQRRNALDLFLSRLLVHPWGREAAAAYGTARAKQETAGRPLGPLDMQIAAHAIALQATLVTNDRAFRHVPGLPGVENWATDL